MVFSKKIIILTVNYLYEHKYNLKPSSHELIAILISCHSHYGKQHFLLQYFGYECEIMR